MSFPTILAAVAAIYWLTRRNRVRNVGYSRTMSPDTVSSLFPDRPIRPLPKRRLREQLSPEAAGSIKYPPSTHNGPVPLFHYPPYTVRDDGSPPRFSNAVFYNSPGHASESSRLFPPRRGGAGAGVIEDIDVNKRSSLVTRSSPEILNRASLQTGRSDRPLFGAPTPSATSSVDGYDSFENTSNKKKRKIPSAADSALNGAHGLMSDFSPHSTGSPGAPANDLNGDRVYSVSSGYPAPGGFVSNSQGISGSGRGRLGRTRNGRSPLRALPDANSTWSGRIPKAGTALWASDYEGGGIISSAIAKAEKLPPQGQENVSLLQQHSATPKNTPGTTQFTFTCDSQVPGSLQWPGHASKHNLGQDTSLPPPPPAHSPTHHDTSSKSASRGSGTSRRKTRRQMDRELMRAACDRQDIAATHYYNNPPKIEDIWICEFCEYERIFGEPPRALIREYEIKDRRARLEEADRKRLLEKAKFKGRKGKKNGKVPAKGASTHLNHADLPQNGEHIAPLPEHSGRGHSTQSEGDEEEDDYAEYQERIPRSRTNARPILEDRGGGARVGGQPSSRYSLIPQP